MRALRAKFVSLRDLLATAWPILLVSAAALYVAYQFVEPAPPKRIVITSGGSAALLLATALTVGIIDAKIVLRLSRTCKSRLFS